MRAVLLLLVPPLMAASWAGPEGDPPAAADFYRDQVAPILARRCAECHGPERPRGKGGLRFTDREALLRGGNSGPAVDQVDPESSLLLACIRREDPDFAMPPDEPLPAEELGVLERWVALGVPFAESIVDAPLDPAAARFFEERIRPLLADNCFACHGPELEDVEGGLRMAGREGLIAGGFHGAALVPLQPEQSLLLEAVAYTNRFLSMPPMGRLPDSAIEDLRHWIELGAPWPDYQGPRPSDAGPARLSIEEARTRWPYTPIVRPEVPGIAPASRAIDAFIDQTLAGAGIEAVPEADWSDLVRRAYVDLTGVPPGFAERQAWIQDHSADRYERLIAQLMASPRYGEHWAATWLDLVRFSETNGYERDTAKPFAWRYRDYVIASFNRNKPYDRFLLEQVAGDELAPGDEEALIATGFLRLGAWDDEPDDAQQALFDERDDIVRTIGEGFLGLTVGCARCHDHMFDPLSQADYYRTSAFFAGLQPFEAPRFAADSAVLSLVGDPLHLAARLDEQRATRRVELEAQLGGIYAEVAARSSSGPEIGRAQFDHLARPAERLQILLTTYALGRVDQDFSGDLSWVLGARESGPTPQATHLLVRGRPATPGERVEPMVPEVLTAADPTAACPSPEPSTHSSGRRLAFARWLVAQTNPMTARVMANRIWQRLFGVGIVATPNDFGLQGEPPSHPELLDWLAAELIESGWDVQALERRILQSGAYRRSSAVAQGPALELDPGNRLLWRQNLRRLSAEEFHDAVLMASGELEDGPPESGSFFPGIGRQTLGSMSRPGEGWGRSASDEQSRRAIYAYRKRGVRPALIDVLDAADPSLPIGRRSSTTTSTQALVLLNGSFVGERARHLASELRPLLGDSRRAASAAFQRVLARSATPEELDTAVVYLESQTQAFADLEPELRLCPKVPLRLDLGYLRLLEPADFLIGPTTGWQAVPGAYGDSYNGTVAPLRDQAPALLELGGPGKWRRLTGRLRMESGCQALTLVLRARIQGEALEGLAVCFEPEASRARLLLRKGRRLVELASAELSLEPGIDLPFSLLIERGHAELRLGTQESPLLSAELPYDPEAGTLALAVLGEAASLTALQLADGQQSRPVLMDPGTGPRAQAFETLIQVLFNCNEFAFFE